MYKVYKQTLFYSTNAAKYTNMLDVFIDTLLLKNQNSRVIAKEEMIPDHIKAYETLKDNVNKKIRLDENTLMLFAETFANKGNKEGLLLIREICNKYSTNGYFLNHLGKLEWSKGNITQCISYLNQSLSTYPHIIQHTKCIITEIIESTISFRSEAQMITIIDFVKEYSRTSNDYFLLSASWRSLFLSDWQSDQILANELLKSSPQLFEFIELMSLPLVKYLMSASKFGEINRLLQLLIAHKMMKPYTIVVQALFDHHCKNRDVVRCSSIVYSCNVLMVSLRRDQYDRFISLVATGNPYKLSMKKKQKKHEFVLRF